MKYLKSKLSYFIWAALYYLFGSLSMWNFPEGEVVPMYAPRDLKPDPSILEKIIWFVSSYIFWLILLLIAFVVWIIIYFKKKKSKATEENE